MNPHTPITVFFRANGQPSHLREEALLAISQETC